MNTQYQQPRPVRRKKTGKVAIVLSTVLVAAVAVTAAALTRSDISGRAVKATTPEDTAPPAKNVLVQKIESGPLNYGSTPAFDACAVLPRTGLARVGFPEDTINYRELTYLPTTVPATVSKVSELNPMTTCGYWINAKDADDAYVVLDIAQRPFNELRVRHRGDEERVSSGLKVSTRREGDQFFSEIGNEDSNFFARLDMGRITSDVNGVPAHQVFANLVDLAAAKLAKGPDSHSSYAFTGRYEGVPFACDVLTAELFTELTGKQDSGLVETTETRAHEASRDYPGLGTLQAVEQECGRGSTDQYGNSDQSRTLRVKFETFRTEQQARDAHAWGCDPQNPAGAILGEPVPVDKEIGDGKPCVRSIGYLNYVFLVGRTEVSMMPNEPWAGADPDSFAREFAPTATTLADHVRRAF
ncbi:hypothetical protein JOF41_005904 [Saccharothrix coeruleofusca]|uniref:hypothetical protein n=1 Tax=Saccharothrix coeruleofusca TaxID=33919 RepID=UPI001AE36315|nr:hypothetical protein [Saccharothrix coeruleofusca]MBP2339726.1 hypothetical protein [Saccharothrix coeruleofusca]